MPIDRRAYAAGHFLFVLDDSSNETCWLKSVDGGTVKASIIDEKVGPDHLKFKHLSTVEIDPITVEVGMSATSPIFGWIQESWKRKFSRRDGAILHGDSDYKAVLEQSFLQALIAETTFPALDASDNKGAYLTVKLQPEYLELRKAGGEPLKGAPGNNKQKMWTPANFRMYLDGVDCSRVSKIDSISVKQKIKQLYVGHDRYPQLEPTDIEFPNISITLATAFADDFIKWHHDFVVRGAKEHGFERDGAIEFLDPTGGLPLFTIKLTRVGLNSLSIEKSEANASAIKRCKVDLYVEAMDLEFGMGLE